MRWLRHPPHPAERLAQRLGFERWHAEYLYSELKRRYTWLSRPGVIVGILICVGWWVAVHPLMTLIWGDPADFRQAPIWRSLIALACFAGLQLFGGLYLGSLAKWHTHDRAIRRFSSEYIDTPRCFACDYGLNGVPRSADGELRCPECTQEWPWDNRVTDTRPHMAAIDGPRQTATAPDRPAPASEFR